MRLSLTGCRSSSRFELALITWSRSAIAFFARSSIIGLRLEGVSLLGIVVILSSRHGAVGHPKLHMCLRAYSGSRPNVNGSERSAFHRNAPTIVGSVSRYSGAHVIAGMFMALFKPEIDDSRPAKPSATMRSYSPFISRNSIKLDTNCTKWCGSVCN